MVLERSSIVASAADLEAFYEELKQYSLAALWLGAEEGPRRARPVPHVWHWYDLRKKAMRATQLVGTAEAERRVLRLINPAPGSTSTTATIFAGLQIVMPGEIARAHRHTMAALRMIIESGGGYTVVNGEAIPMLPGDLVLTPNWTWHDHANDSDTPMIWLDGLDTPTVLALEASFREEYPEDRQPFKEDMDYSQGRYGAAGLKPVWLDEPFEGHSPLMHYPWTQTKAALDRMGQTETGSPHNGVICEYTNPVSGGPVMPTMACYVQLLRPGTHTKALRSTATAIYHVIEGEGYSVVDGERLDWGEKDVFCAPAWQYREHVNTSQTRPAYLFSYTNAPVLKSLYLYREEGREN